MSHAEPSPPRWTDYDRVVADRPPREWSRHTVIRFGPAGGNEGWTMDLGCGTGAETLDLLSRGWHMLAVDQQAEAIAHIHARLPAEHREHLTTRVASCEAVELPAADFIWASLSLSFPAPHHFPAVWSTIASALKPGGRFAGDFFGTRHAWADRPAMTVHTREQVTAHCQALSLEDFIEEAGERLTAVEGLQQWHAFSVIAKKS